MENECVGENIAKEARECGLAARGAAGYGDYERVRVMDTHRVHARGLLQSIFCCKRIALEGIAKQTTDVVRQEVP